MSRTYKLHKYKNGKPVYTRNINQNATYRFFKHDFPKDRRALNKEWRHQNKQYFIKFREVLPYFKSRGWETW